MKTFCPSSQGEHPVLGQSPLRTPPEWYILEKLHHSQKQLTLHTRMFEDSD